MSAAPGCWALYVCAHCDEIFGRRRKERRRFKSAYCSRACAGRSRRLELLTLSCAACGTALKRPRWKASSGTTHFCSTACRDRHQPIAMFSKKAAEASVRTMAPVLRSRIGRMGGLARARKLTPQQLTEIAQKAVAARKANGRRSLSKQRAARARLAMSFVGPLVTWRRK